MQVKQMHQTATKEVSTTALNYRQLNKMDNMQLNATKDKHMQLNAGKQKRMQVTILHPTSKKSAAAQLARATHAGAHRNS